MTAPASRPPSRVEAAFRAWGAIVWRRRFALLGGSLLVTLAALTLLPGLRYDSSTESLLLRNDPAKERYQRFRAEFGQDQLLILSVEAPTLFSLDFLEKLSALHDDIAREVPYLAEVTSLINARDTRGSGDTLIVGDLLDTWPQDEADLAQLRERVFENPFYRGTLVNDAGTLTALLLEPLLTSPAGRRGEAASGADAATLEPLSYEEVEEQLTAIRAVMARHEAPDFALRLAGAEVVNAHLNRLVSREAGLAILGSLLVNALLLALLFRRVSGVLLPLAMVLCALVSGFAAMVVLDIPMSVINAILPRFLIVVGLCNAIHLLTGVYQHGAETDDKARVLAGVLGRSGPPIAMATLTTAGGVLAFVGTDLAQTVNLGISASIGALLVLLYSLVMLPACVAVMPLRRKGAFGGRRVERLIGAGLARVGGLATAQPGRVLLLGAALVAVGAAGLPRLRFAQETLQWFPERDPIRQTIEFLDRELAGVLSFEVLIDSGVANGLQDPAQLERLERASAFAEALDHEDIWVGKATSLVDVVKETHRALNGDDPAAYRIPRDERLVAQELLLFELSGPEHLDDFVDSSFRVARMSLRQPFVDGMLYQRHMDELSAGIGEIMGPQSTVEITGVSTLVGRTFSLVNVSMAKSYVIALMIITPLMILMIGNVRLGLIAMIPNLVPILLTLGLMGWLGMSLNNSTLLLGCVILGLAVDDTIHFMHGFRYYRAEGLDVPGAVQRTLATTGAALLCTSLVLMLGFLVGTTAYLRNIVEFGVLAAFATAAAFLADVFLSPALLAVFARRG